MNKIECNIDINLNLQCPSLFSIFPISSLFLCISVFFCVNYYLLFYYFHYWLISSSLFLFLVIVLGNIIYIFKVSWSTSK